MQIPYSPFNKRERLVKVNYLISPYLGRIVADENNK